VFWAGCGVSDLQMAEAVNMVCDDAHLTVPQEALFKKLIHSIGSGKGDRT
jgi:hypothetical protein